METAFECHRSRNPINNVNTVLALKKHLISFLGLKELSSTYGLGDFDVKLYHKAPKSGGKSDNFALTTDEPCNLELRTDHTGWNRKRIKQYVLGWFGILYLVLM